MKFMSAHSMLFLSKPLMSNLRRRRQAAAQSFPMFEMPPDKGMLFVSKTLMCSLNKRRETAAQTSKMF